MDRTKAWKPKTCQDKKPIKRVKKCGEKAKVEQIDIASDIESASVVSAVNLATCGIRTRRKDDISVKSVSIMNLEFPEEPAGKPVLHMPSKLPAVSSESIESCGQMFARKESKGHSSVNKRIAHFTFSVNYKPKKDKKAKEPLLKKIEKPTVSKKATPRPETRPCYPKKGDMQKEERVQLPCDGSVIAGAPKPFVGICPPNYGEIAKLSKEKQKFYLTEDPRKVRCLVNPEALRSKGYGEKREFETLTGMVKYADNLCDEEVSKSEENFICEIIDKENPMRLDFQGLDYKNTYEKDEQDITNRHVYNKVVRDMERRKAKKDIAMNVEDQLRKDILSLPKCFDIDNRNDTTSGSDEGSVHLCKLYRAAQKPGNKAMIAQTREMREERYKSNYLKKKEKNEQVEKEKKAREKMDVDNLGTTLAIQHFNEANKRINEAIKRSFKKQTILKRKESVVRDYPHTIRETKRFKRGLRQQNRVKRDRARLKMEFYSQMGKDKHYPEADLDITSSSRHSHEQELSTQSSDDEDEIQVGRVGDQIKLRGFHFKLGANLRGKYHEHEQREAAHRVRGCETRDEWLKDLLPKKVTVRPDVYIGIEKHRDADDPNLMLFQNEPYVQPKRPPIGAIQQYIKRRLGRHYEYDLRRNIKLVRPRLPYSVKKFNFIKYSFGKEKELEVGEEKKTEHVKIQSTKDYIETKIKDREAARYHNRKARLDLLGIPCAEIKKSRLETLCENSESSDSDWVPEKEEEKDVESVAKEVVEDYFDPNFDELSSETALGEMEESIEEKLNPFKIPMDLRGNMPAPRYREPTLRINVHRPRDYQHERIPSALLNEVVPKHELPVLLKLDPPLRNFENVREPKRPYTKMLETRHHHDHWDPTDRPLVNVHYQPKIVKPKIIEEKVDRKVRSDRFKKANPPCAALFEADLTLPDFKIKQMIAEHEATKGGLKKKVQQEVLESRCKPYDYEYHSRPLEELEDLDFPGRRDYLLFLKEIKATLQDARETKDKEEEGEERLAVDKEKVFDELEEDLKSIESCLTSMSSSECTNLTNDSGSFLLLEGKSKLPLDYVRNALVPFEELQRSRFNFQVIDVEEEENNPFHTVPFAGQKKEQLELSVPKDSFFTFTTRLRNGLRLRLEVPIEDVRKKLIGSGSNRYPGSVVTDVDENYVKMLEKPPPVRSCKFKTGASYIKDALRMKFESMLIQGQIVRTKIYDQLNDRHWTNMQRIKLLYEKLFAKWKKHEYEAAMSVVYQVKSYYSKTDQLRDQLHGLERQYTQINMDIVFLEAFWIRCIQLQNFHYLLADQDWRHKHDWIHRIYVTLPPGEENEDLSSEEEQRRIEMESFDVSIGKRPYINIRQRDKDDAWAIKEYYYNVYLKNVHPILQVFPDHLAFLKGVDTLKAKTFVLLLEMHFTLSIHTELGGRLQTFQDWCALDLKNKREYVDRKCAKKYFMEKRAADIRKRTLDFLDKPIENSFNEPKILYNSAMILETWRKIVPAHLRGSEKGKKTSEMVAMIMEYALELITRFEVLDIAKTKEIEDIFRKQRVREMKISQRAYQIEKRIEANMQKIVRNMQPAAKRSKTAYKPPRLVLKKKVVEEVQPTKQISDHTKFFIRAFQDDGEAQTVDARESLIVIDTMQEQIVPFYFDHFLKINGYTPNYNFKTQIELRDGPEVNRLQVQYVIPEVLQKMEQWETHKKKVMEEHINRNPHMYINVV